VATIRLKATQDLSAFNLDLRGLDVTSVQVNDERAGFTQVQDAAHRRWEVTVRPRPKLTKGSLAKVVVRYGGPTARPRDVQGALYGWVTTADGAIVANEPDAAMTWYPVSDHPTDKATYSYQVTVPKGTTAVANGLPARRPINRRGTTTWFWRAPDLQASYLSTVSIGDFDLRPRYRTSSGVPILDAVDADLSPKNLATTNRALAQQPRILDYFEAIFGPYPFIAAGAIVDDDSVGYALETQTRPIFDQAPDEVTLAHELSHQWFGDSVSLRNWPDIWLNEGFATWSEWRWTQERGGLTTRQQFDQLLREPPTHSDLWAPPPAAIPGPDRLFADSVYERGAMALEALRQQIGDPAFYATLRDWTGSHAYGNGTIAEFIALAEGQSGQDLDALFQRWLYEQGKPERPHGSLSEFSRLQPPLRRTWSRR
jgi:aminopeptidase N